MYPSASSATARTESELWTRNDADLWKEADLTGDVEPWTEDDGLLDTDLWLDSHCDEQLSISGLRELGIRLS